jgi:predicted nucleic acid-binding protein
MTDSEFFFDTFAFFEIIYGNPKYEKYKAVRVVTTVFNIAELNYGLKKELDKATANKITEKYYSLITNIGLEELQEAMDLKIKNKSLSAADAIGYAVAKKHCVKFLTGDKEFKNLPNVEFVEK